MTATDRLDAWLPQTQCTRCGYPRCRAYAEAIVRGEADINQCPPGGDVTIAGLASTLDVDPKPLNTQFGLPTPRTRARIDETICIGCKKCIDACPTDAIVGAAKLMHTVIATDCTGCGLCVPPCPVDCIALVPATAPGERWPEYTDRDTAHWRGLSERRLARLARDALADRARADPTQTERGRMRAEIAAAVARVRAKRGRRHEQ